MGNEADAAFDETIEGAFFGIGAAYSPERDGQLEQYMEQRRRDYCPPLFHGHEHFALLQKEGWLGPRLTMIRLMWNTGRGDEYFGITDAYQLEGADEQRGPHSSPAGIHDPKIVLEQGPCFEVHSPLFPHLREEHAAFIQEMQAIEAQQK